MTQPIQQQQEKPRRKRKLALLSLLLALLLAAALILIGKVSIIGLQVLEETGQAQYSQQVSLTVTSDQNHTWEMEERIAGASLTSVKLDGSVVGEGAVRAYLVGGDGTEFLILDSTSIREQAEEGTNRITGLATEGTTEEEEEAPAETPGEPPLPEEKQIIIKLEYQQGTRWDADDDGTAYTEADAVDLTVAGTQFSWDVDESKLCTTWNVLPLENSSPTILCNGNQECCSLVGVAPLNSNWDEPFYLYYQQYGSTQNNNIEAQVIYIDQSLEQGDVHFSSVMSSAERLPAMFTTAQELEFNSLCIETCTLPKGLDSTEYTIRFEVQAGTILRIDQIEYILAEPRDNESVTVNPEIKDSKGNKRAATVELFDQDWNLVTVTEPKRRGGPGIAVAGAATGFPVGKGTYYARIQLADSAVKTIIVNGIEASSDITEFIKVDDIEETGEFAQYEQVFAIDPTQLNFTYAVVTATAAGEELHKCREWNFTGQRCDGEWTKVIDLTPGTEYTFTLTPEDPGYAETGRLGAWIAYYNTTNPTIPKYRTWNGGISAAGNASDIGTGADAEWTVLKSAPNTDEKILATLDDLGQVKAQVWNVSAQGWTTAKNISTGIGTTNDAYRGVDVAYEQGNGRAMVVASNGTANAVYNIWNGTAWQYATSQVMSKDGCTGTVIWVVLKAKPGANEILEVEQDTAGDYCARIWNGTAWEKNRTLDTAPTTYTTQRFDAAYESSSGDALIVWEKETTAGLLWYANYSGGAWSASASTGKNNGNANSWVRMASMPTTNRIMIGTIDIPATYDLNVIEWNGTAFGTAASPDTAIETTAGMRFMDVAYIGSTGNALVAYADANFDVPSYYTCSGAANCFAGTWVNGANTTPTTNYCGSAAADIGWIGLDPDPLSSRIYLWGKSQTNFGKCFQEYNGTRWLAWQYNLGNGAVLDTTEDVMAAADRFNDTTAPTITFVSPTPQNNTNQSSSQTTINATATDTGTFIANCTLEFGSTNYTMAKAGNGLATACNRTLTGLSDGTRTYKVYANNTAGRMGVSETRTITIDATPPTYSNDADNSSGSVSEGTIVGASTLWQDSLTLDTALFRTNYTGAWAINSTCTLSGASGWCNKTIDTTGMAGKTVCWNQYANDTLSNTNNTMTQTAHCFNVIALDTTPPATVTELANQSAGQTWIYWNWTNPIDADFNHTEVWINATFKTNASKPANYYNATGLSPATQYEIQTRTADHLNNINTTWVNDTAMTATPDTTPPTWSNNKTSPVSGATYSPGASYQFNTTWDDASGIHTVKVEHNFTGTLQNYSVSGNNGAEYYYNYNDLAAGTYVWRMYANDTGGYMNSTDQWAYTVAKASTTTTLYLNGTQGDIVTTYGTATNATATTTAGSVTLYRNGTTVSNPEIATLGAGYYNYTATNPGNTNYTGSSATWFLTVNKANDNVNLYLNGNLNQNVTITYGTQSNATATSTSGTTTLYRDGTPVSNPEIATLAAGTYAYKANTTGNQNYTANSTGLTYYLTINKSTSTCSLVFDKATPQTYNTTLNASCSCNNPETTAKLWRNNTDVTSTENNIPTTLPAGTWNYVCNTTATQNYTAASNTTTFTINKATPVLTLTAAPSWSETYGTTTTINCTANTAQVTPQLYRNGTLVSIPDVQTLAANTYNYVCNNTATQNYTNATTANTLTISKASTTTQLYLNGTQGNIITTYGAVTNATATTSAGTVTLYRDGTPVSNPEITTLNASTYNYTAINPGNQNYTGSSATWFLTVNKAATTTNLSLNGLESDIAISYPQTLTAAYWTSVLTATLYRNGTDISGENNTPVTLAAGYYNYTALNSGDSNYFGSRSTHFATVSKATTTCSLTFDKTTPQTYGTTLNASCTCNNPEAATKLYRNNTDVTTTENNIQTTLPAGTWNYVCNTTATQNYTAASNTSAFTINKAGHTIHLLINNTEADRSFVYPTLTNVTGYLEITQGAAAATLYRNGTPVTTGSPAAEMTTLAAGYYNYTYHYPASQNYTEQTVTRFLQINRSTTTLALNADPGWSVVNGTATNISCYANNNEANLTLWRNTTLRDSGVGKTVYDYQTLAPGEYNYTCNTTGSKNYTSATTSNALEVNVKYQSYCSLTLTPPSGQTYPVSVNATCSCNNPEANATLWRDSTSADSENGVPTELAAGTYNYVCNVSETANYTSATNTSSYTINKATPVLTLTAAPSWTETYGTQTTINCTTNTAQATPQLYRNGTLVSIPDTQTLAANTYSYVCNNTATQNYTNATTANTLTISKASTTTTLYLNNSQNNLTITYGAATNATATTTAGTVTLYRNGTTVSNPEIATLGAGYYNYTATNPGNTNYTGSSATWYLTVNKAASSTNLLLDGNDNDITIEVGSSVNITAALATPSAGYLEVYRNGTLINAGSSPLSNNTQFAAVGTYNITAAYPATQNYTASSKTHYITVQDTTKPTIGLNYPPNNHNTSTTTINFSWTTTDNYDTNLSCNLTLDGNVNVSGIASPNGTLTSRQVSGFSNGPHTWSVGCADDYSNAGTSPTRGFSVDATPPTVAINSPLNTTYNNTMTALVDITATDPESGVSARWYSWNGTNTTYTAPVNVTFNEGGNTLHAWANNTLGNEGKANVTFGIDSCVPNIVNTSWGPWENTSTCYPNSTIQQRRNLTQYDSNYCNETANQTFYEYGAAACNYVPPTITGTSISPYAAVNGSNVSLYINATNFEAVWAEVTRPDGSRQNVTLANDANTIYSNTGLLGRYNVTFHANDSAGTTASDDDYFETFVKRTFNITIINSNLTGINTTLRGYYRNGTMFVDTSTTGNYTLDTADTLVDLEFDAYTGRMIVTTWGTNISDVDNRSMGIDRHSLLAEFLITYGVEPEWNATSATLRIAYDDLSFTDEGMLRIYRCDDYNFTSRTCNSGWEDVTGSATQNTANDYFQIAVTGFSGFSIKEAAEAGTGGAGIAPILFEQCREDWACTAWSSCADNEQTRECHDRNSCGTELNKPYTRMLCYAGCIPAWQCTEWSGCKGGSQARECTDAHGCNILKGKPEMTRRCTEAAAKEEKGKETVTEKPAAPEKNLLDNALLMLTLAFLLAVAAILLRRRMKKGTKTPREQTGQGEQARCRKPRRKRSRR